MSLGDDLYKQINPRYSVDSKPQTTQSKTYLTLKSSGGEIAHCFKKREGKITYTTRKRLGLHHEISMETSCLHVQGWMMTKIIVVTAMSYF